ncbi:dynein light chain Tctex-type 5-B-like isoform X2 [Boleophthalmus pectinirostris]|nr:dynein light chain Tctex-type 5-B-like isoform X2 [Boleophthalmus pectinirostris]
MSDLLKDRALKKDKKMGRLPSDAGHKPKDGRPKDSISTVSHVEDPLHHDDTGLSMENTYQLGPYRRHSVPVITEILRDVLTCYLQHETYEAEWSRQMTKTLCDVIRSRVKELMIQRYKTVVVVNIGQLSGQGMQISSRCLWDATNDNFATYSFKNSSLFGVAIVYVVYFE